MTDVFERSRRRYDAVGYTTLEVYGFRGTANVAERAQARFRTQGERIFVTMEEDTIPLPEVTAMGSEQTWD